jgi:hypothetical protein
MAAKKTPLPPSIETREEVLRVIRDSKEPVLAASIPKLVAEPHKITTAQLSPILEEYVAAGTLHLIPPAKAAGKPRYWDRDFAAEMRAAILRSLQQAGGPLTAKEVAGQAQAPVKLTEGDVAPILESLVRLSGVFRYAGSTAKSKPRYWDQDLGTIGVDLALATLAQTEAPVAAKDLAALIKSELKFSESDLTPILEKLVAAGRLHAFPAATAKGKPRFWDRDLAEVGRLAIIQVLEKKGPQTEANLKKGAKGLSAEQFVRLFHDLVDQGKLLRHPPLPGAKGELFGVRPPSAATYLNEIGGQLTKIVAALLAARVSEGELRQALVQLMESTGISFGGTSQSSGTATLNRPEPVASQESTAVELLELMKRLEPGAERGALVGSRELRRASLLEKSQFDSAVLDLARHGKLSLHRHDYASSLNQQERDDLVTDGAGTYYVGMAIRHSDA